MKSINTNTILQIVALLFLVIIGYMTFNSGSNWKIIKSELDKAREELRISKDTLAVTKSNLKNSIKELEKMNLQKDIVVRQRDSLLFDFKRKNAKDWNELEAIKDTILKNNEKLTEEKALLDRLFGIE
ncbi:hypothetical protein [Aquimarina sediminis]|uniref:hypothetical protein n=1 Tax=Aquimarina sediminis TaxID=2070536 RepID=UPI000FFEF8CD|nr:hypothetical protein [Aquimarina sediminis]